MIRITLPDFGMIEWKTLEMKGRKEYLVYW